MGRYDKGTIVQFLSVVFSVIGIVIMVKQSNPCTVLGPAFIAVAGITLAIGTKIKYLGR